jgi:enoyl-CoA hydratase/carnithine racemase
VPKRRTKATLRRATGGAVVAHGRAASGANLRDTGGIEVARDRGCVSIVLARPSRRNRISAAMARRLIELAEEVEDDDSVLVATVTGAGPAFCAGFDDDVDPCLVESLAALSKPTLAIINGDAIDEGLELAMALDIRVAESRARMGLTQLKRGMMPRFAGSQRLSRLVGIAQALRMMLTGALVTGDEAARIGLVTRVAGGRSGLAAASRTPPPPPPRDVVESLRTRGPLAARLVKEAVLKGYDMTLDQGIRLEEDLYALLQTTTDRTEGVKAFLGRRKPLFKGA